jgi:hypothetical protein
LFETSFETSIETSFEVSIDVSTESARAESEEVLTDLPDIVIIEENNREENSRYCGCIDI